MRLFLGWFWGSLFLGWFGGRLFGFGFGLAGAGDVLAGLLCQGEGGQHRHQEDYEVFFHCRVRVLRVVAYGANRAYRTNRTDRAYGES